MKIFMYRTSGGKDLLKNFERGKTGCGNYLIGITRRWSKNFSVKPIDKNISPTLYEIKRMAFAYFII